MQRPENSIPSGQIEGYLWEEDIDDILHNPGEPGRVRKSASDCPLRVARKYKTAQKWKLLNMLGAYQLHLIRRSGVQIPAMPAITFD